jgi:hypothetical protein
MELPKTASGRVSPTRLSVAALPSSVGTSTNLAGDEAVGDAHLGGQDALFGNAEIAHALGDHPFVGGADGPNLDAGLLRSAATSAAISAKMRG